MEETPKDLERLERLLMDSIEQAGPFLKASFQMPEKSLSARQLAHHLQGLNTVALSTVTRQGAPRVAPISALFYRGEFYIPSVAEAARTRMLRANPEISLTYFEDTSLAVIIHGRGEEIGEQAPQFPVLEALHEQHGGSSPRHWGEGVFLRIVPRVMFTYAKDPVAYPEEG